MQKQCWLIAGLLLIAATGVWADFLDEDKLGVRADVIIDPQSSDDPTLGAEIGFGSALYALDDVGIFGGYREDSDMTLKCAGGYIEQHLKTGTPFYPYIGLGGAYGWLDRDGFKNEHSVILRFLAGVKFAFNERIALSAGVIYSVSLDEDLYLDQDGNLEDTNLEFAGGLRIYY